jgi:hypothetical protein
MDVCLLCLYVLLFCVGRSLCDGLITRPGVLPCVWLSVIKKRQKRIPRPNLDSSAIGRKKGLVITVIDVARYKPQVRKCLTTYISYIHYAGNEEILLLF